ncbi:hypothetical protein U1Q18_024664, partial [Sarracenia purpurea var. burkii]
TTETVDILKLMSTSRLVALRRAKDLEEGLHGPIFMAVLSQAPPRDSSRSCVGFEFRWRMHFFPSIRALI